MDRVTIPNSETSMFQTLYRSRGRFFTVCFALVISLAAAEIVEINRFLRTVVQGRAFWDYLLVLLMVLGLLLVATVRTQAESEQTNLTKFLLVGVVFGFIASFIAILATPLLEYGTLSPTINAWRNPLYLASAAFLGLGWFYGALAELTIYFIRRGRYKHIGILVLTCIGIRLVEMLPLARLLQR